MDIQLIPFWDLMKSIPANLKLQATHPFFLLLRLGPILRSFTQMAGEERERILKRPPLLWRESLGATGVKTPDNQSGILVF